jgi:hypothetical protein
VEAAQQLESIIASPIMPFTIPLRITSNLYREPRPAPLARIIAWPIRPETPDEPNDASSRSRGATGSMTRVVVGIARLTAAFCGSSPDQGEEKLNQDNGLARADELAPFKRKKLQGKV